MYIRQTHNRTVFDIIIVTVLSIFLSFMSLSIQFIERVYNFFYEHAILEYAEFLANFSFLYLAGLLWFTFKRWRKTDRQRKELEEVISSINNDVLIVSDRDRNIIMCNNSIERMLGYKTDDVIKQKTDLLYFDTQAYPEHWHEIYEKLEKEGFHVELATGRKQDGSPIPLEIITWNLSGKGGAVQLLRDITERRKSEEEIKNAYLELNQIFNIAADGICLVDTGLNVIKTNDTLLELLGVKNKDAIGKKCYELLQCTKKDTEQCSIKRVLNGESRFETEIEITKKDKNIPCILTVNSFRDLNNNLIGIIMDIRDITERKHIEEKLRELSLIDELTGLYNRRGFMTLAEQHIKLSMRTKRGLLLFYIDLNRMKWINDTFGHDEGDRALKETSHILRDTFRKSDIVARIGGDEFAVIAIEAEKGSGWVITERLKMALDEKNLLNSNDYKLSISIGSAYFDPETPCELSELINAADKLMYEDKRSQINNN